MISEGSTRNSFQTVKILIYYGVLVRLVTLQRKLTIPMLKEGAS